MLRYHGNIKDFWTDDLINYRFPHSVSTGQREGFHKNYFNEANNLLQGFGDELPECHKMFFDLLDIKQGTISWTNILPSCVIPTHNDAFHKLREQYSVNISKCIRYLVFLQEWELGHMVEFEEQPITKWKKGDVWIFDHLSHHCAANTSNTDFITCQVNTVMDN